MELDERTLEGIADSERQLTLGASEKYGSIFDTSHALTVLFSQHVRTINKPEKFFFIAFHAHLKRHLILSLLSAIRRHHVQASMNMRQVLESGAWAAFALAHSDPKQFSEITTEQIVVVPARLERARNKWLDKNYPTKSTELKRLKKHINESSAHAHVVDAVNGFKMRDIENPGFSTPIFDLEHENQIRSDIWFVGNAVIGLMNLFDAVNDTERVFTVNDAIKAEFNQRVVESGQQRKEMMARSSSASTSRSV